jgi:hypothetical protein
VICDDHQFMLGLTAAGLARPGGGGPAHAQAVRCDTHARLQRIDPCEGLLPDVDRSSHVCERAGVPAAEAEQSQHLPDDVPGVRRCRHRVDHGPSTFRNLGGALSRA